MSALAPGSVRWWSEDAPERRTVVHGLPLANPGFREGRRYVFELEDPDWRLLVDDEPLAATSERRDWQVWAPGFFAGEVTAELVRPDGTIAAVFLLDVAPDPAKAGRETFSRMLNELWSFDPGLVVGTEPATARIGELGEYEDPWIAFARLRRWGPDFVRALSLIRRSPRLGLRRATGSTSIHQVRHADRRTADSILRGPAAALFADVQERTAVEFREPRVHVPIIEHTIDIAINRAIRSLARAVRQRASAVHSRLRLLVDAEPESATRTSLTTRWPARSRFLKQLCDALDAILRKPPLADVADSAPTAAGLTAMAADPVYARAWGQGWRAVRHGIDGLPASERSWISPSWELYERWCFVRLGALLEAQVPAWNWRYSATPRHRWVGSHGGRHAQLLLQPVFGARSEPGHGRWSISRQRIPDIVFAVDSPDGGIRFVVMDAKYRASHANVLDAMASAHIYQDSLRFGRRRPESSLLLVPAGGGVPHLEDPGFLAEHRVGVHPFSPDAVNSLPRPVLGLLTPEARTT